MPTVPTYTPRVSPTAQPSLETGFTPRQTGQETARALGQAGQQLQQIAMETKRDADALQIKKATAQLDQFEHQMYDPQNGVFSRKGENALNIEQEVEQEWKKLTGDIEQGLYNETQKQQFNEIRQNRFNQILRSTRRYQLREFQNYSRQQDQSSLEISRELAADNFDDPERVDSELGKQATILLDTARREGWSEEQYRNELAKQVSQTHVAVLDRMSEASPVAAVAYYEKNKDELYGDDEARVSRIMENKALVVRGNELASNIIQGSEQKFSEWRKKASDIEDPKLRKQVLETLESNWADVEQQRKETIQGVWQQVERGIDPRTLDDYSVVPSETRAKMEDRYRDVRRGIEPTTDDRAWLETQSWSAKELAGKSEDDIFNYRTQLDDTKWNKLVSQWRDAVGSSSDESKRMKIDAVQSDKDRVNSAAINAGIIQADERMSDLNEQQAARYVRFQDNVERRFESEQLSKGRQLTPTEKQDILDDMVRQTVFVDPGIFSEGEQVPAAAIVESDTEEGVYVPIEQIPAGPQANMRSLIERNGWTDGDVEERMQQAYAYLLMNNEQAAYEILKGDN